MSTNEQTILITGFGPFPGADENPSALLARKMTQRPPAPALSGCELVCGQLPTHWQQVRPALTALLARYHPQFILHLGYAATSPGFQIENTAYNRTCDNPDVDGVPGDCRAILNDGPALIKNPLSIEPVAARLNSAGFTARTSSEAGLYLCNMAYYLSLCHALGCSRAYPVARHHACLFVHIPAIEIAGELIPIEHEEKNRLSLAAACDGLELLLEEFVRLHNNSPALMP